MTRTSRAMRISKWSIAGVAVIVALGFGALEARASFEASKSDCLWHPPTYLGSCTSTQQCQSLCEMHNPERPVLGVCDGCCSCVI